MVIPSEKEWSEWLVIEQGFVLTDRVLHELLIGGQTFQWHHPSPETDLWIGLLGNSLVQLRTDQNSGEVLFRSIGTKQPDAVREDLRQFFRLDEDHSAMLGTLPLDGDPYLARCVERFPGLRILRQPIEEVLLTFLCSSNKQITQIRRMIGKLCERWGEEVYPGWFSYPQWKTLAEVNLDDLAACGTGYRGKYIFECARLLAEAPGFFTSLTATGYRDAKAELMHLPGVGPKVADCILLYGGGYYESFPLDTWILKAMIHRYGKNQSTKREMEAFASGYFGRYAGIAQQYIFAYEREVRELSGKKRIS